MTTVHHDAPACGVERHRVPEARGRRQIDALLHGERWLPRSLAELAPHAGVAWTSVPDATARRFRGWAWPREGPLPVIPWDLGEHGTTSLDLDRTLSEAAAAGGVAS